MKKILVAAGLTLLAGQFATMDAQAASCSTAGYSTTYAGACSGNAASSGTTVTSSETVAIATSTTAGLVAGRLSGLTTGSGDKMAQSNASGYKLSYSLDLDENGKSAGNGAQKFGVWANVTGSRFLYDKTNSAFDGNLWSGMIGADYRVTDKIIAGLGFGYETTKIDTTYNEGNLDSDGYTVAPYAAYIIDNNLSVGLSGGYSWLNYDMDRKDQGDSHVLKGTTDADRWFAALNLNGNWTKDKLAYGANVGTLYTSEKQDGFTETGTNGLTVGAKTTKVGRLSIGGDVGYELFDMMTPYVKAKYNYDYKDGGAADRDSLNAGLGIRFNLGSNVTAGLESTGTFLKKDYKEVGGSATLRVQF